MSRQLFVATINLLKISFDPARNQQNLRKHRVSLEHAEGLDWDTVMVKPDTRRDYGELREIGYGLIGDRLYCVVLVQRSEVAHVISLRKANSREVRKYVEQAQDTDA